MVDKGIWGSILLQRILMFLSTLGLIFMALTMAATFSDRGGQPAQLAQSVSTHDLTRLLRELKSSGRVPPDATICTVNWLQFGIQFSCSSFDDSTDKPLWLNSKYRSQTFKQDSGQLAECNRNGREQVRCLVGKAMFTCMIQLPSCDTDRGRAFGASIVLIDNIQTQDICSALLELIWMRGNQQAAAPSCSPGGTRSEIDTQNSANPDQPKVFVHVRRLEGTPPTFVAYTVFFPKPGARKPAERFDFLIHWAFNIDGAASLNVVPLFAQHGDYSALARNLPLSDKQFEIENGRDTNIPPTRLAADLRDHLREAGFQP